MTKLFSKGRSSDPFLRTKTCWQIGISLQSCSLYCIFSPEILHVNLSAVSNISACLKRGLRAKIMEKKSYLLSIWLGKLTVWSCTWLANESFFSWIRGKVLWGSLCYSAFIYVFMVMYVHALLFMKTKPRGDVCWQSVCWHSLP